MKILARAALTALLIFPWGAARAADDPTFVARARALHDRIITVDTHVDIPTNFGAPAYDMMKPGRLGQQVHLPTMIDGGLDAVFLIVFVGQGERTTAGNAKALSDAFAKFAAIHKLAEETYPDKIGLALTPADVRRIHASGRKVAMIGVENGYPIGTDLRLLDQFYDYGARYFGLVHNGHNDLADSAQPTPKEPPAEYNGLSPLGKQVVRRLNQLGIMVDVSHSSAKSTLDIAALSTAPIIASHSAVKAVTDHPRNLDDAGLDAIKRTGGVVQIVAFDSYLRPIPKEKTEAMAALRKQMGLEGEGFARMSDEQQQAYSKAVADIDAKWSKATVSDLVDHIDYAVKRIGIDHVGIASDFNGGGGIAGWNNAGETFNVTLELVKRGYSDVDVAKLWGENLLRVMENVQAIAARTKK